MIEPGTKIREKTSAFAETFPGLSNAPGIRPWDASALDDWAASGEPGHGALCAAQFVLSVWNPKISWSSGKFDIHEALAVWDKSHCEAFLVWVAKPWWP